MTGFPRAILDYWLEAFDGRRVDMEGDVTLTVVPTLSPRRPAMILEGQDGSTRAALTPELAEVIGIDAAGMMTVAGLRDRLTGAGVVFHDPDFLFYLAGDTASAADQSKALRQLTDADRAAFDAFQTEASEQDLEDAYVELDHWAVFGCFDGDRLVSAASALPWQNSRIADLGVLTLSDVRGKGYARAVVEAISRHSRQQDYEPQYRCQLDNHGSVALAKACGLTLLGEWIVASDAS
ncbi:GNAT family N-acetyltransferase [Sphingomonas cynarae]|uniref:GNAT family N-acetyltransferase n=1 Tax=Sphingomonas cynarae TaxID=930197 RepID=A0ABP7EKF5_9SPHN